MSRPNTPRARARAAAAAHGVDFLNGVEVSVTWNGKHTVHIVGLGIDPEHAALKAGLQSIRDGRVQRAQEMSDSLARIGIHGAFEGAMAVCENPEMVGRTHFARFLVQVGRAANVAAVFRSTRSRVAALVAYAANPLPYAAIAAGRWAPLAVYGAMPWAIELIRRASGNASSELTAGDVRLDTRSGKVTRAGEPVKLTAQEYKLLSYLLHHKGKVVSRTELIEHIYDQDFDRDSNTIEVFVTRIRKKLGQDVITTIRGLGYSLEDPDA